MKRIQKYLADPPYIYSAGFVFFFFFFSRNVENKDNKFKIVCNFLRTKKYESTLINCITYNLIKCHWERADNCTVVLAAVNAGVVNGRIIKSLCQSFAWKWIHFISHAILGTFANHTHPNTSLQIIRNVEVEVEILVA